MSAEGSDIPVYTHLYAAWQGEGGHCSDSFIHSESEALPCNTDLSPGSPCPLRTSMMTWMKDESIS
jgi:hypothetical protein